MELTHWEYIIYLHTCNLGDKSPSGTNPFTGEPVEYAIDRGLVYSELEAVRDVFDSNEIRGPEPNSEGYAIYGSGGDSLRFRCHSLDARETIKGMTVEIVVRHLSTATLETVLDVARAGNLALTSCVGDRIRIVDREPNVAELARWPDAESISSVHELRGWIEDTIGGRKVRSGLDRYHS